MSKSSLIISLIYAIFLIVGGVIGFIKAGSMMSLLVGLLSAILIFLSYQVSKENPLWSYLYIAALSLCLSGFFIVRFFSTYKFFPHAVMLILSVATLVTVGISFIREQRKS